MTPVIIDAIVVVILVAFTVYGAKRGLLRTLAGLLIVVVALVGASMLASTFSAPGSKLVTPIVQEYVTQKVEDAVTTQASAVPEGDTDFLEEIPVEELLTWLGLDEDVRENLAEKARENVRDTGASIALAVVESMVYWFVHSLLFVLAFIALVLLLKILVGAMGIMVKLPGLHGLNALGGGILGLVEGALLLFLAVWVARRLGVSFETETMAETYILRIFTVNTPLSLLSFLQ